MLWYHIISECSEILRYCGTVPGKMSSLSVPCLLLQGLDDVRADSQTTVNLFGVASSHDKTIKLYDGKAISGVELRKRGILCRTKAVDMDIVNSDSDRIASSPPQAKVLRTTAGG